MELKNTTGSQDSILSACEEFGGKASDCAYIAEDLDTKLTDALNKIEELETEIKSLRKNQKYE